MAAWSRSSSRRGFCQCRPTRSHSQQAHLQQTTAVFTAPRADDLEARNLSVPGRVVLRVLCTNTSRGTIGATEDDGAGHITARHVVRFSSRVDDLVDCLHGKAGKRQTESAGSVLVVTRCGTYLNVMNSQIGRRPLRAAPTAIPVNPASVMGVSITLRSPNLSSSPLVI